ncbi:hypothetical protein GALMADRAFT_148540 [Galerina marginata CBS 339.88]|uniref:Uncharacterized protein n=1 Tax=Galerina marginata (strain CBS 339.88) TaxID=685588 RepID=A0A067SFU3_GALM3|nr:hypothetical protein GALMADRAFT_148540 [Galerina marginata CBS 339.88]
MQQSHRLFMGLGSTNELGIIHHRKYETKYRTITSIKIQPDGGNLLAAANELGTLLLYDLLAETDGPQQFKVLSFEFGGISELFWVSATILVVGTTRGNLVVFSLKNDACRLFEVCNIKAHGDGASLVAVQSVDFCQNINCLVSVGEGVGSVRLWNVASDAFHEPRFVTFIENGSHVLVGFFEHILIQKFSIEPWALAEQHTLGQHLGAIDQRQLGNAILISDDRLLVSNLKDGFDIYETTKFNSMGSGRYEVEFGCSQGISMLRNGSYIVAVSAHGRLNIYRARDNEVSLAGKLRLSGSGVNVHAIHANSFNGRDIIAAASCGNGNESSITIWMNGTRHIKTAKKGSTRTGEYSTFQTVLLSVLVYVLCQLLTSLVLLPNLAFLSTSLVGPVLDLKGGEVEESLVPVEVGLLGVPSVADIPSTNSGPIIPAEGSLSLAVGALIPTEISQGRSCQELIKAKLASSATLSPALVRALALTVNLLPSAAWRTPSVRRTGLSELPLSSYVVDAGDAVASSCRHG